LTVTSAAAIALISFHWTAIFGHRRTEGRVDASAADKQAVAQVYLAGLLADLSDISVRVEIAPSLASWDDRIS
jgi:hypothetical protein